MKQVRSIECGLPHTSGNTSCSSAAVYSGNVNVTPDDCAPFVDDAFVGVVDAVAFDAPQPISAIAKEKTKERILSDSSMRSTRHVNPRLVLVRIQFAAAG